MKILLLSNKIGFQKLIYVFIYNDSFIKCSDSVQNDAIIQSLPIFFSTKNPLNE